MAPTKDTKTTQTEFRAADRPTMQPRTTPSPWRRCTGEVLRMYVWQGEDPIQGLRDIVTLLECETEYQLGGLWGSPMITITTTFTGVDAEHDQPVSMQALIH